MAGAHERVAERRERRHVPGTPPSGQEDAHGQAPRVMSARHGCQAAPPCGCAGRAGRLCAACRGRAGGSRRLLLGRRPGLHADEPGHIRGAGGRHPTRRADRRRGLFLRHRDVRPDRRLLVPARPLHGRRRARHRLRRRAGWSPPRSARAARRRSTCSCAPTARIVAGGVASMDVLDPGSFALVGYLPNGAPGPGFGSGGRVITRVGSGFDAISDLVPGPGDQRGRGRAGGGRRARPLRARALRPPRRARPELRQRRRRGRADLRALRLRRRRRAAARRARRRGRRLGLELRGREPPLQRRAGRLQRRRERAVAPPDRRLLLLRQRRRRAARRARARGRRRDRARGNPAMALVRTSPEGALDRSWDGDGIALVRARDGSVATDVVLDPRGRAVAAGHASAGAGTRSCSRASTAPAPWTRGFGGGGRAHRLPGRDGRARDRARPPGRRQARRGRHRLRVGQRPAVRRRDGAARARPLRAARPGPAAADPAARRRPPPATPGRSSRCRRA